MGIRTPYSKESKIILVHSSMEAPVSELAYSKAVFK